MLYCRRCGKPVNKKDKLCPFCNADLKNPPKEEIRRVYPSNNGIIYAVLSIFTCFLPGPGIVIGIVGIIAGKKEYNKKVIITSIVGTALSTISLLIWILSAFI